MKTMDIALKDLKHIFKSIFSLMMMIGAPLLLAGLMFFAFGGVPDGKREFTLPVTKVVVANLDRSGQPDTAAGNMLVGFLQDPSLADIIEVQMVSDEAAARQAVDRQRAGVAIIIPPDFSASAYTPDLTTQIAVYQDPTLTIGPGIVKDLISHYMDAFSGAKIASQVAAGSQAQVIQKYTAWLQSNGHGEGETMPRLAIVSPAGDTQSRHASPGKSMIGPIMAGFLVFFVFFMGANGAESIIHEDEQGTLARLFTTPTSVSSILSGKLIGIVISLLIQVFILLLVSMLLFRIEWGQTVTVLMVSIALIISAAGFGLLVMSFVKNSRQTGPVLGGVMTLTGLLGGVFTVGIPNLSSSVDKVTLIVPQGWALQSWKLALSGAGPDQVIMPVFVLMALGLAFFALGVARFNRRYQ